MTTVEVPLPAGLLSVDEAEDAVLAAVPGPLPAESVDVADLPRELGRALAAPVRAATDLPPWDNSAMDGYAVRAADVARATDDEPVRLTVVGEVAAGAVAAPLREPRTALRIATGAPLPEGADAVVPVELTTPLGADDQPLAQRGSAAAGRVPDACLVHEPVPPGGSVRRRGEDVARGTVVADAGVRVTPAVVALVAGAGASTATLHRRPRVGVLATGDEVRRTGDPLGPAGIPDANGPALRALVASAGGVPVDLGVARDRLEDVVDRLAAAVGEASRPRVDLVVVSGGVSVGPYDVVRDAFGRLGRVDLWRVAVQPGKPFAFGIATGGALLFGLPGNPVSTFVTFELFVRPALRALAGLEARDRRRERAVLLDRASTSPSRRTFLRVIAERDAEGLVRRDESGRVLVRLAGGQGSHVLSALATTDALAVDPEGVGEVDAGAAVELWWLES